ncbi:MAG: ribonuclease H-like domain-containing protein [Anaerolineales bacterium]|nr:ribonuclease H-like domain-containing protein [Anaerolineales bacterium]
MKADRKASPPSLADKLKSLGVKVGMTERPRSKPAAHIPIEAVVPGDYRQTRSGESFVVEQRFPLNRLHGNMPLRPAPLPAILAEWAQDARIAETPIERFLFFDTETSGLAGGTGTYAFMVGAGYFSADEFVLAQFFLRDPSEEAAMLEVLADFMVPCEVLVSYNGKSFDAPLLKTRYRLQGMPIPFAGYAHLDLLHLARRLWRERLASRTLQSIEAHILGVERTSAEVPGREIPYLYFDYLRDRDATRLKGVFYHNEIDILSLATLLGHAAMMLSEPFGESVRHSLDVIAIAKLYEDLQHWDEAARLYEHGLQGELSTEDFARAVKRLSVLQRRRGDIDEAVKWWRQAAEAGHIYAHVELAKYYEHRLKNFALAAEFTQRAQNLVDGSQLAVYVRMHWQGELTHRLQRLERKLAKG